MHLLVADGGFHADCMFVPWPAHDTAALTEAFRRAVLRLLAAEGLPIACSSKGRMPEVLGEAGVCFNPEDPIDIAAAIRRLIESPMLRDVQ